MNISRRQFVKSGLALSALSVLPACSLTRTSTNPDEWIYDLTAEPASAELVPGYTTNVLGFNGENSLRLSVSSGAEVTIRFTNNLIFNHSLAWVANTYRNGWFHFLVSLLLCPVKPLKNLPPLLDILVSPSHEQR